MVREDSAVVTCCAHLGCGGTIIGVRRGRPRKDLGAFEPVSQHGGGGLPREPWIGALSPCVRLPTVLPFPRRTPSQGLREKGALAVDVIHPRCAGLDISKRDAKVCVRINGAGRRKTSETVTTFGATTRQIMAMRDHLVAQKVTCVVMEATGDYWKPFY